MNFEQAARIDQDCKLLPGGTGEHEFSVVAPYAETAAKMEQLAEDIGLWVKLYRDYIIFSANNQCWKVYYKDDRVVKVTHFPFEYFECQEQKEKPYWDITKARIVTLAPFNGYNGTQGANYNQPDLGTDPNDIYRDLTGYLYESSDMARWVYHEFLIKHPELRAGIWLDHNAVLWDELIVEQDMLYKLPTQVNWWDALHRDTRFKLREAWGYKRISEKECAMHGITYGATPIALPQQPVSVIEGDEGNGYSICAVRMPCGHVEVYEQHPGNQQKYLYRFDPESTHRPNWYPHAMEDYQSPFQVVFQGES